MNDVSAEDIYVFKHELVQQAAYQLVLPSERSGLHVNALDVLENVSGANPAELALHARLAQEDAPIDELESLRRTELQWTKAAAELSIAAFDRPRTREYVARVAVLAGDDRVTKIQNLCWGTHTLSQVDAHQDAIALAEQATEAIRDDDDEHLKGLAHQAMGAAVRDTERHRETIEHYRAAEQSFRTSGDLDALPGVLSSLAACLLIQGKHDEALEVITEAGKITASANHDEKYRNILMNSLLIELQLNHRDRARELLDELESMPRDSSSFRLRASSFTAYAYDMLGEFDRAAEAYRETIVVAEEVGSNTERARSYTNLAGILEIDRRFPEALKLHQRAEKIAREIGDRRILASGIAGQANVLMQIENFHEAHERITTAIRISTELGLTRAVSNYRVGLAMILAGLGRADEALARFRESRPEGDQITEPLHATCLAGIALLTDDPAESSRLSQLVAAWPLPENSRIDVTSRGWIQRAVAKGKA